MNIKKAAGPSGLTLSNDWGEVNMDCAYGEWRMTYDSKPPETLRSPAQALYAAIEYLAGMAK